MAKKETKTKEKPVKVKKQKEKGGVINMEAKVRFVSFTIGATIPTQSFGNIQPHITVEAPSYEEALAFAIPKIEELYKKYAEIKPEFLGKISETVREVTPAAPKEEEPASSSSAEVSAPSPASSTTTEVPDSEPVKKAKKAIELAATYEAVKLIEEQIMKSVKIKPEEKPLLYELVLKKAKVLKNNS